MSSKIRTRIPKIDIDTKTPPPPKVKINLPQKPVEIPSPLTLKNKQISTIDTATPSSNAGQSVKKVRRTVRGPSLYDRVFTTENLQIGSLVACSAAAAAAFGTWALKIGALPASQIVATNVIEFLQPGMTVVGYALKAGMFITLNAVVPLGTALVTISLPIVSTIVVTTISVLVILHVVNKMIQKLEESVKSGIDVAKELPGKLLEQIPGYSIISSVLGYSKDSPSEEKKNVTEKPSKRSDDFEVEKKPRGTKRKQFIYTHQDFLQNRNVIGE